MTRYNLNIHHRDAKLIQDDQGKYKIVPSPVGHFYISLQEEGKEELFFGKYPKGNLLLSLIGPGNILSANEKEAHEELTNKEKYLEQKHVYTKAVTVSKEEYDKGLTFAKGHVDGSIGSNFYFIGSSDCRHFIQDVWHAMGRPLYYTVVYTKAELQKLGTIAATDILKKYGSRDDIQNNSFITEGLSAVSLSVKLNVAIDKIEAIDALNLRASYMSQYFPQIIESLPFKVTIDSTLLNKALAGVEGVIENVTVVSDSVQDQRLSTMNKLFNEFKIPNVTNYEVPYKGFDVNFDVNSYKDNKDYSTEYTLNIHHKSYANYSNSSVENNKMGKFFISFSEPNQKIQSFYGNDIDSNVINNNTIHTKSIILSLEEYGKAVKCAKSQAMNRVKDGNIYDIGDIDERNFIQDVWNAMGRPLYFTSAYSTHELQNLGTTSATDLLSMYGSFDILKHGKFIDKDLSKDMLANRLNIEVKKIEDIPTGLNQDPSPHLLKHFMINIDDEIMTKARIGVVPENCKPVIRYKSTNSTAVSENLVSFNYFQEIVISIMQKYKSMFENKIEFVNCANFSNGFKYEYNQRQPELFNARYELIVDSFHPVPNETHFVTYVLGPQLGRFTGSMRYRGEAMNIHMWYVSMFTNCFNNILGYNINVPKEEVANLVNNITARWNDKIDSLISNPTLNDLIKTLPASLNNTSNIVKLISDTLFNEISTLGFNYYVESNVNNNKVERYVECMNYMDNNAIEFVSRNSASTTKPVGYNLINWIKYNISQLKYFYARSMKQVEDWFKSNDMQEQFQIDSDILNYSSCEDNNLFKLIEYGVANNKFLGKGFKISQEPNKEQKTISNINGDAQGSMLLWSLLLFKKYGGAKYYIKQDVKNSVDSEYACRLAYSAYAPSVAQNEDIGLLGASYL